MKEENPLSKIRKILRTNGSHEYVCVVDNVSILTK